jgi:hypothetical protein
LRLKKQSEGTLFRRYFLVQAADMKSALRKANRILAVCEHLDGDGVLRGKRINFWGVGIITVQPLYEPLASGVEVLEEQDQNIRYGQAKRLTLSARAIQKMIAREEKFGKQELLPICWGDDFDEL